MRRTSRGGVSQGPYTTDSDVDNRWCVARNRTVKAECGKIAWGKMFKVTRFCVLPYVRQGKRLVRGEVRQFHDPAEAAALRARLLRRHERVDFYEVTGWPVQDLWDRPRRLG
jgi:hypothetical protein